MPGEPGSERLEHLQLEVGRSLEQVFEVAVGDDEHAHRCSRRDRRRPRHLRDERDLAEEVAGPPLLDGLPVLDHLDVAFEQDEELAAALTLANEVLARRQFDLVGDRGDLAELLLVALREQRRVLQQLDLLVAADSSEAHGRSLSRKTGRRPRS